MSVEAQVAKLEEILSRVQRNRAEGPTASVASSIVSAVAAGPAIPEPSLSHSGRQEGASSRAPKPTPMEMALLLESEEPEVQVEITVDAEEPEIVIEAEPPEESIPTAPVGTRAPLQRPEPATGKRPALAPSQPAEEPVNIPATAAPSTPIARVVARPEPRTFGELLDRALALRPR
jgi:hypothetical protein